MVTRSFTVSTGGTLAIGSGLLGINDFNFNALPGLDVGTYVLFDNAALSGTLGTALNGRIATGYHGTLRIDGNDIVMDVTPPPEE